MTGGKICWLYKLFTYVLITVKKKIEYQVHDRVMHTATKQFLEDTAILNGIPKLIMKTNFSYY